MLNFLDKFRPAKVEKPSVFAKIGKGVLIGVGVVAGIAAVLTLVEVVLVKFFKKCITITVQCTDLSAYDEEEEYFEEEEEDEDAAEEEVVSE